MPDKTKEPQEQEQTQQQETDQAPPGEDSKPTETAPANPGRPEVPRGPDSAAPPGEDSKPTETAPANEDTREPTDPGRPEGFHFERFKRELLAMFETRNLRDGQLRRERSSNMESLLSEGFRDIKAQVGKDHNAELKTHLLTAIAKAQADIQNPERDKKAEYETKGGQKVKYNYASMSSILDAIRKALTANDIWYSSIAFVKNSDWWITVRIYHGPTGQAIESTVPLILEIPARYDGRGNRYQGTLTNQILAGSITYMTRYLLGGILGIAGESDRDELVLDASERAETVEGAKQYPAGDEKPAESSRGAQGLADHARGSPAKPPVTRPAGSRARRPAAAARPAAKPAPAKATTPAKTKSRANFAAGAKSILTELKKCADRNERLKIMQLNEEWLEQCKEGDRKVYDRLMEIAQKGE